MFVGERNGHIFCLITHCPGRGVEAERGAEAEKGGGREREGGKHFFCSVQQELKEKNS